MADIIIPRNCKHADLASKQRWEVILAGKKIAVKTLCG